MYKFQRSYYCDPCGEALQESLLAEGIDRHFDIHDVREFPQGPFPQDEPVDTPEHCASGSECLDAILLPSGHRIGAVLSERLSAEGVALVRLGTELGREIANAWAERYSIQIRRGAEVSGVH